MSIDFPKLPDLPPLPGNGRLPGLDPFNPGQDGPAFDGPGGSPPGLDPHGPDFTPPGLTRLVDRGNPLPNTPGNNTWAPPAATSSTPSNLPGATPSGLPAPPSLPALPGAPTAPAQNPLQGPLATAAGQPALPQPGGGSLGSELNRLVTSTFGTQPGQPAPNPNAGPLGQAATLGRAATANALPPSTAPQASYTAPQSMPQQAQAAAPQSVPQQAQAAAPQTPAGAARAADGNAAVTPNPQNANAAQTRAADTSPPPRQDAPNTAAPRNEPSLLDRLAAMLRLSTPPAPPAAAQPAATAAEVAQQALPLAATATVAGALATQAANDPRVLPPLAANDRVAPPRSEIPLIPVYTAEGPLRRPMRRRVRTLPGSLSRWLYSMGLGVGMQLTPHDPDPEQDMLLTLQWLFWLLAIVAYGCLALALIVFLVGGGGIVADGRPSGGGIALGIGLAAAAGAWWLARRMTRRR